VRNAVIEQIVVQGDKASLIFDRRTCAGDECYFRSGKLTAAKDALNVDMDLSADRLVWEEFGAVFSGGDRQRDRGAAEVQMPPLEGVIRLKSDSFAIGTLVLNPLQVTASLTPNGISGEVENSVLCGIRTVGMFTVQKNDQVDLDVQLSVRDGELESTTRCLSSEEIRY
jgi:hypothetical protein